VGIQLLSEVVAGALFPLKPFAVLTYMVYDRQVLEQRINLISDYKFSFYMKIPKKIFIGQVYGTLLGQDDALHSSPKLEIRCIPEATIRNA
jgi:hypothetical protein